MLHASETRTDPEAYRGGQICRLTGDWLLMPDNL
jgi:hypothetical protein